MDAGDGEHFDRVLAFAGPRLDRRVVAKGAAGTHPAIKASEGKIRGGGRLFIVGADGVKGTILTRLVRGRTIRFSDTLETSYFEQLASEKRVVRYVRAPPPGALNASRAGARKPSIAWFMLSPCGSLPRWTRRGASRNYG